MKAFLSALTTAFLLISPILGQAHTGVANTNPKSGSELAQSPPTIEIQFHDSARLTSLVVVGADKRERKLEFSASEKPNTFKVNEPKLEVGRNEIVWKALSNDGHVATGTLVYVIKPASKAK
jgi:methionine-rich copper-binding protein CopC